VKLSVAAASEADAPAVASIRTAAAERLTRDYGRGHWSSCPTERSVLRAIQTSRVMVARKGNRVVGTLTLATKKPWAIDTAYFQSARKALYLLDMAVDPDVQRRGIGRRLVREGIAVAREWPSDAIRLDAYDADAGAGGFYAKCGFREVGRVIYRKNPLVYFELLL
jgi:ribosomal protein S18 acetylase RimI-like enzyme